MKDNCENENLNFNDEPVFYCESCLSLKVRDIDGEGFCDECGSTVINTSSIEEWEEKYTIKYGHKFI